MTARIKTVAALEILDSRGNPTIQTTIVDTNGYSVRASVPSGASTGSYEAVELRDGGARYHGRGVARAIANICDTIQPELIGTSVEDLRAVDELLTKLDGTQNKQRLGANAILSVSLAAARLAALQQQAELFSFLHAHFFPKTRMTLPCPMVNVINGGRHATNSLDFQEYMIIPAKATSFNHGLQHVSEIYQHLRQLLAGRGLTTGIGDEGGFAPDLQTNVEALELLHEAITSSGYTPRDDILLGLDLAANELRRDGWYVLAGENRIFSADDFATYLAELLRVYPIASIEDPFGEDDWDAFIAFTRKYGKKLQVVGDDVYATNPRRLQQGIADRATNAILVKLNQIGTVSETADVILQAQQNGLAVIISHRSGETVDTFIADLAVACGCGQIKTGAVARSERVAKYNRLLEIEAVHPDIPVASFQDIAGK